MSISRPLRSILPSALCLSLALWSFAPLASQAQSADETETVDVEATESAVETEEDREESVSVSRPMYPDVPADHWAYDALNALLQEHGLQLGYPDGSFRGNQTLTRYEMAAVLLKILEKNSSGHGPHHANGQKEHMERMKAWLKTEMSQIQSEGSEQDILDRLDTIEVQQMDQQEALMQQWQKQLPFRLSGSIALRHEHLTNQLTEAPLSSTPQSRVILSLDSVNQNSEGLDPFAYGARLSVGNLRNSTNPWWRLGDFSARVEFALDRFFIRWQPTPFFDMTAGKFANVYTNSELFMDTDVQPEGMFQRFHVPELPAGWRHLSFILGETVVNMNAALGGNTFMLSAKGDTGFDLGFANLDLSLGYHQYIGEQILFDANALALEEGLGVRLVGNANRNSTDARFGIANGAAALSWQLFDIPMRLSSDYLYNALMPSKNQAVQAKFSLGETSQPGQGQLSYLFKYLEQDASVSAFVEDQLQGTDVMAHEVQASLKVWDKTTLFGTYQWSQRLSNSDTAGLHTLRVGIFQAF